MTRDEIIEMARQAGFEIGESDHSESIFNPHTTDEQRLNAELERFAALVATAEREECAKVCEGRLQEGLSFEGCAAAIRARGKE
jgi:hypothetical protein